MTCDNSGTWALAEEPPETACATAVAEAAAVADNGAEGAPVLAPALADDEALAEDSVTFAHTVRAVSHLLPGREWCSPAGA